MKNKKSLGVVSILTLSIISNSVSFAIASTAMAADATQTAQTSGFSVIAKQLKIAHKAIDSGADAKDAAATFASSLVENGVTMDDVDAFVKTTQSPKQYDRFKASVDNAMAGVGDKVALSGKEFAEVLAVGVNGASNNGAAWAGCGGFAAGIILAVAAVVVGIVALTKTKGVEKIKSDYLARKQARDQQYQSDKYYIDNASTTIPQQIVSINSKIASNNQQIAYLQGQNSALDPNSAQFAQNASSIASYQQQNTDYSNQIVQLTLKLSYYLDPNNKAKDLAALLDQYNTDITQLNQSEANDESMVPRNKRLAKTLGIVAGASAVLGTVLIIGGHSDCN